MFTDMAMFNLDEVRSRFASRSALWSGEIDGDFMLNPAMRDAVIANAKKKAAVLVGLVERQGESRLILTKRTEMLTSHSGQIAFPGGKIDDEDASPEAAALREAWEEIGLDQNEVEVIGRLPDYHTGSGFVIAPVVGHVAHFIGEGFAGTGKQFMLGLYALRDVIAQAELTEQTPGRLGLMVNFFH